MRDHAPASKTGRNGPSRSNSDVPRKMDGVLCHHRTPHRSTKRTGGVPDGRSLSLSQGGSDSSLAEDSIEGR